MPSRDVAAATTAGAVPDAEALHRSRRAAWERAARPTFALQRVTDEEDEEAILYGLDPEARGRGRDYGTVIHRLLEYEVRGLLAEMDEARQDACVRGLLREAGIEGEELSAAALASLQAFRRGPLAAEIERAGDQVYAEVPVADRCLDAAVEGGGEGAEAVLPTVRRGVIDLVYRVPGGGWKIVDTKTHPELTQTLRAAYARQVARYAEHWEAARGEAVVERGLWLAVGDGTDRYLKL